MVKLNATIVTQKNYGMSIEKNKEEILINEIAGTEKLNVESVVFEYDSNYESDCIELIGNLSVEEIEAHFNRVIEYVEVEGGLILEDEKLDQVRTKKEVTPTFDGINRIAGEPKNNYYYGLKVQNIKVNDFVCVTSGMIINKVLEVKKTAKGITLVLENNRNRNFRNDTIVIVANNGLKQVDINIIDIVNDGCMALMMEEIILNNNIDKYKNVIKNHSDKIEVYRRHLEILGLIKIESEKENKEELKEIAEGEKANLIAIAEEYKKQVLAEEQEEGKEENKILVSIYGEGQKDTPEVKTYDIQEATNNFNTRLDFASNQTLDRLGGYYKTFIVLAIPEYNNQEIKFRYDLDYNFNKQENILKFILEQEQKQLEYFKENMYNFTWIKDKEKYIKQYNDLFTILEKYLYPKSL